MRNLLPDAVRAVQRGLHVFPVNPPGLDPSDPQGKQPHLTNPPYHLKWSDAATNDIATVVKYWKIWPDSNIGVACKPSGILVVDCDIPKQSDVLQGTRWEYLYELCGGVVDGEMVYDEICQRYGGGADAFAQACDTFRVRTGSGGLHLYYQWPVEVQASQASLVKSILDIRCNGGERGGYVLGVGSVTSKGTYTVVNDPGYVQPCPPWLVELCKEQPYSSPAAAYAQPGNANHSGLISKIIMSGEGDRNACLLWAARAMCTDGADIEEAIAVLGDAAQQAGLGLRESENTIRSGYRLQTRKDGR